MGKATQRDANYQTGRPTKLTPDLQAKIVEALKAGNYAEVAARHVGIASSTFYDWMKRGGEGDRRFSEFSEAIGEAEAFAHARAVTIIAKAMADDWKAAAWYLERKYHDEWGRRDKLDQHVGGRIELSWQGEDEKR